MSYVCAYSSVQLGKRRVEKEIDQRCYVYVGRWDDTMSCRLLIREGGCRCQRQGWCHQLSMPDNEWCTRHATLYFTPRRTGSQRMRTCHCVIWSRTWQVVMYPHSQDLVSSGSAVINGALKPIILNVELTLVLSVIISATLGKTRRLKRKFALAHEY